MIKKLFFLGFVIVTLPSCVNQDHGMSSIKDYKRNFEKLYEEDGLFSHFSSSISNESIINSKYLLPIEGFCTGYLIASVEMGGNYQRFYPDTFIYKSNYKDLNFIVDNSFKNYIYYDTARLRNVFQPDAYPIPYFEDFDFNLGSEKIEFITDTNVDLVFDKYIVPEDLEVFVLKVGIGDFWKIKCEEYRPETLEEWKNGYSSGVAISRELNIVLYWMMAW